MTAIGSDWRVVEGVVTTWFDAPSLSAAAALGTYITGLAPSAAIDLRSAGVRVRLDAAEQTGDVSAAAQELGLVADPGVLPPPAAHLFWNRRTSEHADALPRHHGYWRSELAVFATVLRAAARRA